MTKEQGPAVAAFGHAIETGEYLADLESPVLLAAMVPRSEAPSRSTGGVSGWRTFGVGVWLSAALTGTALGALARRQGRIFYAPIMWYHCTVPKCRGSAAPVRKVLTPGGHFWT